MKRMLTSGWHSLIILLLAVMVFVSACSSAQTPNSEQGEDCGQSGSEQGGDDGGDGDGTEELMQSVVRYYAVPDGVDEYDGVEIYLEDERLPLYSIMVNDSHAWTANNYSRVQNGVGLFELDGKVNVTVKVNGELDYSSVVRPLSVGIVPIADIENSTLTFTISSAGEYVLEINGDPLNAVHLFVSDYNYDKQAEIDSLSQGREVIYFGAGLHTAETSDYINEYNIVNLGSDTLVYIDDGAVVRAKFLASNADNIVIAGRGIIDGSAFDRDAAAGTVTVPLEFNYCTNVTLSDFSVLDPAGWCVNFYFIENGEINDIKIITSRSNGDGISIQSCSDIAVDGCFVRAWDDALVVKNYPEWSDRSKQGTTRNISFTNCTIWSDLAQCMEVGYETVGEVMTDISFENITVLHAFHYAVFSIHNANNADITGVSWKDITIEDASMANGLLAEIQVLYSSTWSDQHAVTALGSINGVTIENVKILSGARSMTLNISGCRDTREGYESEHYVNNVTVSGITFRGNAVTEDNLNVGNYVNTVTVNAGTATGSVFVSSHTAEELEKYTDSAVVGRVL